MKAANSSTHRRLWTPLIALALLFGLFGNGGFVPISAPSGVGHAPVALAAGAHARIGGTLTIDNETGGTWTCSFNPFSPSVNGESLGIVYEPLIYVNSLTGKQQSWLATSYKWSNANKKLTFTMRSGVRWSDGKPFSAADVVFTFNLMKKYGAADLQSVWSVLSSVRQQGNKVVMTFKRPSVPYFYYIADQDSIVPKHIWARIKNPITYADRNPVGTGPFLMQNCSPEDITYKRNPHYWQKGKPYLDTVQYPAFTSNPPANAYLATGRADWGGQFIPKIKTYYVSRDPANNHYWFPPTANVALYVNQTVYPLSLPAVRRALAYAINRPRVSTIGEYGYEPAANQTGVILPTFKSWYDSHAAASYGYRFEPSKAAAMLKKAGFKRSGSGYFETKSGHQLSFNVINVGGNTDWVASLQVIQGDLQQAGIKLDVQNLSSTDYDSRLYNGRFDLAYYGDAGGPSPYYEFRNVLFSANSAPIGKPAASNYERWRNRATDNLLNAYAATTSSTRQHAIMDRLQAIMLKDVPIIPVTEGVSWYQWSTAKLTGWPTQSNPYANPAPYAIPDWEVVLINVHQK